MDNQKNRSLPAALFYAYAQEDELLCQDLEIHLSLLRRLGLITEWHQRKILPGADRAQAIEAHLMAAQVLLLLVSPDFLASDFCDSDEMRSALERERAGMVSVIPLLLRPVDWHNTPFAHLQYSPRNGKFVTMWDNRDAAFREIALDIRSVLESLILPQEPLSSRPSRVVPNDVEGVMLLKADQHIASPITLLDQKVEPGVNIIQKVIEGKDIVGLRAREIRGGQVRITQDIQKTERVTGAEFDTLD